MRRRLAARGGAASPGACRRGRAVPGPAPSRRTPPGSPAAPPRSSGRHSGVTAAARIRSPCALSCPDRRRRAPRPGRRRRCDRRRPRTAAPVSPSPLRVAAPAAPRRRRAPGLISSGSVIRSTCSAPSSCPTVRAPRIGATTPGRSRTQASATSSGDTPRPSAAVATASTMPEQRGSRYGATNRSKCGDAARESAGRPCRYLPVSTPRPSGDHGSTPRPERLAGRQHLPLDAALQQRVLHLGGDQRRPAGPGGLPGGGPRGLPAGEVGHARRSGPGRWPPRGPARPASPPAACRGSYPCTCHRSTWSVPSRRSDASRARSRWPREPSRRRAHARAAARPWWR